MEGASRRVLVCDAIPAEAVERMRAGGLAVALLYGAVAGFDRATVLNGAKLLKPGSKGKAELWGAAKAVTGAHWNGKLFFGLTKRKTA
jgi:hypothetical protein